MINHNQTTHQLSPIKILKQSVVICQVLLSNAFVTGCGDFWVYFSLHASSSFNVLITDYSTWLCHLKPFAFCASQRSWMCLPEPVLWSALRGDCAEAKVGRERQYGQRLFCQIKVLKHLYNKLMLYCILWCKRLSLKCVKWDVNEHLHSAELYINVQQTAS